MKIQEDSYGVTVAPEPGVWYSRSDPYHGPQSPVWIGAGHSATTLQHLYHHPDDDDSFVGQSVAGIQWKEVEQLSTNEVNKEFFPLKIFQL